jgi:hypothetical protein
MPSTSKKQAHFMAAIAHNPAFAKAAGVPQSVGKDFNEADKGKKFGSGGSTRPDVQGVNKPKTNHGKMALFSKGGDMKSTKMANGGAMSAKMGAVKTAAPSKDGVASKGKTKGTMIKMGGSKGQNGLPTKMSRGGKAC